MVAGDDGMIYCTGDLVCRIKNLPNGTVVLDSLSGPMPINGTGEILKDVAGRIWVRKDANIYPIFGGNPVKLPAEGEPSLSSFLSDGGNRLYASYHGNLFRMEHDGSFTKVNNQEVVESTIRCLLRYDEHSLLLGTDGEGIKLLDETTGTVTDYPFRLNNQSSAKLKVHRMMRDREGNLWCGLYQKGVAMLAQERSSFGYVGHKIQAGLFGESPIQGLADGHNDNIWVGTDGSGLFSIDTGTHLVSTIEGGPAIINAVYEDSEGTVWLGSYDEGCFCRRRGEHRFVRMSQFQGIDGKASRVFDIVEDKQRNIWLATMGDGLYCYNLSTKQLVQRFETGLNPWMNCVMASSHGYLLVGTYDGIFLISPASDQPMPLLRHRIVYSLHEDAQGRFWAGTSEGLVQFSLEKGFIKSYTTEEGLPSSSVYAITSDVQQQLWLSTNAGLSCFDPDKELFVNYTKSDGLQGNEFTKGSMLAMKNGELWFGGLDGLTFFQPDKVKQQQYALHPRITNLYLNNMPANAATKGVTMEGATIYESRRVTLGNDQSSFCLELATTELNAPEHVRYSYQLDNEEWNTLPHGNQLLMFSNMPAGNHTLRFRCTCNGFLSEIQTLEIEVLHPWWSSVFAKLVYLLVLACMGMFAFFWIRSREKVKVLALLSHKVRTPLSLIISPLLQLIEEETDPKRLQTLQTMLRSASKLQQLAAEATEEEPIGPIETAKDDEEAEPEVPLPQSRTTLHILVVEDDDDVRRYLKRELSVNFHVTEACNGKEAYRLIQENMPDAVISDVTMPEMDGITLCKKIKKNIYLAHIPVVLLTARADEESTLQGLGTGADAYITKPFSIKIVRQKVQNLILLRQQLRNTYQGQVLQESRVENLEATDYDERFMDRLMECINKHLGDPDFSVEQICEEVGISRTHLHRKLKEKTNQSTSSFIRNLRLKQAERLLRETDIRVNEIAEMTGFRQLTHFSFSFKEQYGLSPVQYRAEKGEKKV